MKDENPNTPEEKYNHNLHTKISYGQSKVYNWLVGITNSSENEPFNIVEVKFKGGRKEFYLNSKNLNLKQEDIVVVQAALGHDTGLVSLTGELVRLQMKKKDIQADNVLKKIYRKANSDDYKKLIDSKVLESIAMYKSRTLAKDLNLKMKICDVAYQGDLNVATFYYTAENRVDFRELILVLTKKFSVKIVMRQISQLEEIRRLGGIGNCGREYCFSAWQTYKKSNNKQWTEFKCCLFEDRKSSKLSSKDKNFTSIKTLKGIATLQKNDIEKKIIWYGYSNDTNLIPLSIGRVKELQMLIN
jgi:cell fate regulator YaaT (PSP1 superfamily)